MRQNHRVVSFYMDNVVDEVVAHQKAVFDKFGYQIEQIRTERRHGDAIEVYLSTRSWEVITLFDIDCIPLRAGVIEDAHDRCVDGKTIFGAAQQANQFATKFTYASPAFCSFSLQLYERLGKPSFVESRRADVGGELSLACIKDGCHIDLLYPTHVEERRWRLEDKMFGLGCTYGDKVYHAFRIRKVSQTRRFVSKCIEVLGGSQQEPPEDSSAIGNRKETLWT